MMPEIRPDPEHWGNSCDVCGSERYLKEMSAYNIWTCPKCEAVDDNAPIEADAEFHTYLVTCAKNGIVPHSYAGWLGIRTREAIMRARGTAQTPPDPATVQAERIAELEAALESIKRGAEHAMSDTPPKTLAESFVSWAHSRTLDALESKQP